MWDVVNNDVGLNYYINDDYIEIDTYGYGMVEWAYDVVDNIEKIIKQYYNK